jgi:hypothetical protein
MKLRLALSACCAIAVAAALPAVAGAGLPKQGNTLIVPNKSIGGIALGAKAAQVTAAWGGGKCELQCVFEGPKSATGGPAAASVLLEKKSESAPAKVWLISLNAGTKLRGNDSVPDFDTPLANFKTSKGIGIGSTVAELVKAYPKAKRHPVGESAYYSLSGPGEIATNFNTQEKRITNIDVELHPGG